MSKTQAITQNARAALQQAGLDDSAIAAVENLTDLLHALPGIVTGNDRLGAAVAGYALNTWLAASSIHGNAPLARVAPLIASTLSETNSICEFIGHLDKLVSRYPEHSIELATCAAIFLNRMAYFDKRTTLESLMATRRYSTPDRAPLHGK